VASWFGFFAITSVKIRFEMTEGGVWFKVDASGTAYEAALVALLDELRPGLAPEVLAGRRRPGTLAHSGRRAGAPLARSTGCVTRAVAWERTLREAPSTVVAGEEFPVRAWFLELLRPWTNVG
jgi:hypothetical protein